MANLIPPVLRNIICTKSGYISDKDYKRSVRLPAVVRDLVDWKDRRREPALVNDDSDETRGGCLDGEMDACSTIITETSM